MRQIVLDTETTGMDYNDGHRIIEIGCVEMVSRRMTGNDLHMYIHPDREIDQGAIDVHGITLDFLADKPRFNDIAERLAAYLADAELIIHNAPFDLGFLNHELGMVNAGHTKLEEAGPIIDTLADARQRFPGQRNSLDALCKRFEIDNSNRELHGALLDAQLLADVYLRMTGGQIDIGLAAESDESSNALAGSDLASYLAAGARPRVQRASADEGEAHEAYLDMLGKAAGGDALWRTLKH
ncbi:DNA polymerase III subunit epsilon [Salinisphaera sp.]|uniref:DNA polymerase III subunit epsilon n=1 Tax=Salinisphaera sp. TaxID=1914330 RepID=UPI000C4B5389|nr:DNA polymerase III subunit epsilon [Salinisphaera sp.]MAS08474.1 DNA polymerase III subunit epsilon [Salinisphaera sp.]|tara:strand:+ start:1251 stop:1970 length:720 start_codon:yes stop_codon:yes gene_type:complete